METFELSDDVKSMIESILAQSPEQREKHRQEYIQALRDGTLANPSWPSAKAFWRPYDEQVFEPPRNFLAGPSDYGISAGGGKRAFGPISDFGV